jgi:predicted RNA-binding protein with PIN domain
VTFLIDGYNLMHAVGFMTAAMKQSQLSPARTRLLDWLADSPARRQELGKFHVVFDAQKGPGHTLRETTHRAVVVEFAHRRTADDRIEELLDGVADARRVVVVSNDLRLHEAARRARAQGWFSAAFLDWLDAAADAAAPPGMKRGAEKPDGPMTAEETAELLEAFTLPPPKRTPRAG